MFAEPTDVEIVSLSRTGIPAISASEESGDGKVEGEMSAAGVFTPK